MQGSVILETRSKKYRILSTVQHNFRLMSSERQLRRWAIQIETGGNKREVLMRISEYVLNEFRSAVNTGRIVHDRDLRRWALKAYNDEGNKNILFKASRSWVNNCKKVHHIVSRKIRKFLTRKTLEDDEKLKTIAQKFVQEVKPLVKEYGPENVHNSGESGFQLEIHSGRSLASEGPKKVECVVQSVSSKTHSYTIQPTVTANGRLLSPLFIVLKEKYGQFGSTVGKTLFSPTNVYVKASKSGNVTSGITLIFNHDNYSYRNLNNN